MLNVPIEYRDVKVLHTGDEVDLVNDFNLNDDIDNLAELVLADRAPRAAHAARGV